MVLLYYMVYVIKRLAWEQNVQMLQAFRAVSYRMRLLKDYDRIASTCLLSWQQLRLRAGVLKRFFVKLPFKQVRLNVLFYLSQKRVRTMLT